MGQGRTVALIVVGLVATTLLAYANVAGHGFVSFDDPDYSMDNARVQAGLTLEGIGWAFTTFHASNWHPLTWLSHMLDHQLFGPAPGAQHVVNAVLHALNAVLCFLFLRAATRRMWPAAVVAALFALHPLRVMSVAWISERKDLLCATFFLLTLLAYLRYAQRPVLENKALVVAACAGALLSKPTAVSLPFVLLLLDAWPLGILRRNTVKRLLREKAVLFAMVLAAALVTVLAQRSSGSIGSLAVIPLEARTANALLSLATYIGHTAWPMGLAFFHPHPAIVEPDWVPWSTGTWIALAALVVVSGLTVWQRRRRPYLGFGWAWFVGMLLPVIGLVQVGEQSWAERYAYLPLIGIYVGLVYFAAERWEAHPRSRRPLLVTALVILAGYGIRTFVESGYWHDSNSLYRRALDVTERNYVAHTALGNVLRRAGRRADARREYEAALAIKSDFPALLYSYGLLIQEDGDLERARELYAKAVRINPRLIVPRVNLGSVRAQLGDLDGAMELLEGVLAEEPHNRDALFNTALISFGRGALEHARARLEQLLAEHRGDAQARTLMGVIEERAGNRAKALRHLRIVCGATPLVPEAATHLAWILATAPEDGLRDGSEATAWAQRAVAATGETDPAALESLAAALAEDGRFEEALVAQERALALIPPGERAALLSRLQLYRTGKPFRDEP